ncbi:FAD/NAD(P)-binding domain-containing protein [Irpex rosettiformis]|uniref:FAD/NAD(P)-binding domain-containing protein n=1 Tax=Irpex rosettiformis TaxID=378272 RepID=A0ACB8U1C6_9APHY|nr:FAD/NAD(P)-binding domain-containing protein [Irpex rosettiformis]
MADSKQKFRVAICGAGIGGLTLAVALARYPDIDVQVYESAGKLAEIGAGVMIWGRTWKIMTTLGLAEPLRRAAGGPADKDIDPDFGFEYRRSDKLEGHSYFRLSLPFISYLFHRAHFLNVLVDQIPSSIAHLGKRLRAYTQNSPSEPITLEFADGTTATCDLLVGSDGIKSAVRRCMYEGKAAVTRNAELLKHIEPRFSGWVVYRTLVPVEKLTKDGESHRIFHTPMMYCGYRKHVVSYGIAHGKLGNVVGFYSVPVDENTKYDGPWVSEVSRDEVVNCYVGWENEVQELIAPVEKALKWAIHELRPLPTYVDGRVALLGDAAHAMTPHQGSGAGQAVEDAYVLAGILGDPSTTRDTLLQALQAYDYVRVPFANHVLQGSYASGRMYEFWNVEGADYSKLPHAITHQWDWVKEETPEQQIERALKWVQEDSTSKLKQEVGEGGME